MKELLHRYLHGAGTLAECQSEGDFEALCQAAAQDLPGRLRWKLLRRLNLPPFLGQPDRDALLYALAQLALDREEALQSLCPACRSRAQGELCAHCGSPLPTENPGFDEKRYEELKNHENSAL